MSQPSSTGLNEAVGVTATLAISTAQPARQRADESSDCQLTELANCIDRLNQLGAISADVIDDLRRKIAARRFDLVVAGQFKRGKTSLVNALVGAELLPVAVVPLTSIVTAITYGPQPSASVVFESGEVKALPLDELAAYVTERGNPGNGKGVREAHVTSPSTWLRPGIRLVDTPGVGSIYQKNTDVTRNFLPKADALLFLLSVDQPISQAECDFLADVREHSDKIFFILNKTDLLSERELAESLEFTRGALATVIGGVPNVFPLSARHALAAALQRSDEQSRDSGMSALTRALADFLTHDKDAVLLESAARQARRAINMARFSARLQLTSLTAPLDELERKARLFHEKKCEIALARDDFEVLLGNDAGRALQRPLEEALTVFKDDLKQRIVATQAQRYVEARKTPLRQLHTLLEDTAIKDIQGAFDTWRTSEEAAIDKNFAAFCARHTARIDAIIDEIFRFAADLFAIPAVSASEGGFGTIESHFYYTFWSEPPSLRLLTSSLVFLLPRAIGARLVADRVRQFALERIEMQAGRMRYDFSQRLDKALAIFKRAIADRLGAAIASIETAMQTASRLRTAGDGGATEQRALLSALQALDEIDDDIARLASAPSARSGKPHSEVIPRKL